MAEEDAPKRDDNEEETPRITVPSHAPLPPPPTVHFTRPNLNGRASAPRSGTPGTSPGGDGAGGHGAGLAAGFTFVASILAGLLAGTWLDGHFNHSATPWFTMLMTLAGTGVGFSNMYKLLSRDSRRKP